MPLQEHAAASASTPVAGDGEGLRIRMAGIVQGVGFRPWVFRCALQAGVTGRVRNDAAGVTIDAFGSRGAIARFVATLDSPPPAARVDHVDLTTIPAERADAFEISHSDRGPDRHVSIPADLPMCAACTAEIVDPRNRRYRYAFTNCTDCGPRFTIATDVPYDRAATTMAQFGMCPSCRREYKDATDRRFHAQPNACAICGPQLELRTPDGTRRQAVDVIAVAARAIADGRIVAVKGLGGFHLACDATSQAAVERLRRRKHRDEKPLAVMVRDLAEAARVAVVDQTASALLTSIERPIVLLRKRPGSTVADAVAPGNRMLGVMLPYSPLHHLLLTDARRPVVMTSGNLSDEPIVVDNSDALERLAEVADLFILHDRDIATRCDDSVVAVVDGGGMVTRRSRGYVPRSLPVARGFSRPVLGCGGLLKNTFCLAAGTEAWLGPHIGDLQHLSAFNAYTAAVGRMERFLDIRPEVIAYDMHPDYVSTHYARQRPEAVKVAVQHHHAHIVSAMVEHAIDGPAIGIAYDGTGFGTDGTMWGGEVLVATAADFHRAATFRPLRLIGGDRAIEMPWRQALALVDDAFDGAIPREVRPLLTGIPDADITRAQSLLHGTMRLPLARGVGRYFDAFGALFLGRRVTAYEGQIALEWNQAADPSVTRCYRFDVETTGPCAEIDLRPTLRDAVADYARGEPIGAIAAAFHNALVEATADVVRRTVARVGALPIVASGGCFQNAWLAEGIRAALSPAHDVRLHRVVPPGDGGIALGQAVIADAVLRK
jgi:hydrogenase maturation protein HypF